MTYVKDPAYNPADMQDVMDRSEFIVRNHREWFNREVQASHMHKFIVKAIDMARPDNWQKLLLQWPHMADNAAGDYTKLAYTRDERAGIADRQTVTTLGKYLRAHFSVLPDEAIRDIVALAQSEAAQIKIVRTTAEMIYHLHRGPGSCMQWEDDTGVKGENGEMHHPYEVYTPELGWGLAVRTEGDNTVGRALVYEKDGKKIFVRSYKKTEGYSPADEQLEAWLTEEGYAHKASWRGAYLKLIPAHRNDCGFVAPYLDGDDKEVCRDGDVLRIVREGDGDYQCDHTDGSADETNGDECSDCGERIRSGDGQRLRLSPWEDAVICEHCIEHSYVYAYGRNRRQYYVHQDGAVYVESCQEYYHDDYLDTNEIVILRNGDAEHLDNAIEVDGDYYHVDDERIVRCVDDDEFHLKRDAYHHEDSGEYYADEDEMPKDDESEDDEPTPE